MNSSTRALTIWKQLSSGIRLNADQLCLEYNCGKDTIQRDIRYIRDVFGVTVEYDSTLKSYGLTDKESLLTVGEVFLVILMLYNSRSLNRGECSEIINRLVRRFPADEQTRLRRFFNSFNYSYEEVTSVPLLDSIQILFESIMEQKKVTFLYPLPAKDLQLITRELSPVTITYHKGSFFLLGKREDQIVRHYRVDRMSNLQKTETKFYVEQGKDFFRVGEYRNRSFNMFSGEEKKIRLRIPRNIEEYLRRECPKLQIINRSGDGATLIVEVTTLGYEGILFWIFSQQEWIEVLAPEELRTIMKQKLQQMSQLYEK
jgi:predicted DNA-binding transcriptional regulator YafY